MDTCPFCELNEPRILIENDAALLTYSIAPYHKYHLLVIPKRHVENIKDLTWDENVCIMALLVTAIKALDKLDHNDCTIVARDGKAMAKSIPHLHYNIIPGGNIEDISLNTVVRKMLDADSENALRIELNKIVGTEN